MGSVGQTMHAMPPIMIFQCSQRHRIVNMVRINHHCIITQKIPFQQVIGKIRRTKMTNSKQSKSLKLLYFASKAFKNCSIIIKLRLMIHFFLKKCWTLFITLCKLAQCKILCKNVWKFFFLSFLVEFNLKSVEIE